MRFDDTTLDNLAQLRKNGTAIRDLLKLYPDGSIFIVLGLEDNTSAFHVINAFFDTGASIDSYIKELDPRGINPETFRVATGMIMDLNGGKFHDTGTIEKSRENFEKIDF